MTHPADTVTPSKFWAILLPCLLLIGAGIGFYGHTEIERDLSRLSGQESLHVAGGAAAVSGKLDDIARDLAYLSSFHPLRNAIETRSLDNIGALTDSFASFSRSKGIYDQLRWIDETGQERVRVDLVGGQAVNVDVSKLQNKGNRYYFTDAFKLVPGEIFVSPLDLNIEQNKIEEPYKPMVRIATPVVDAGGTKRGIVILNYFGRVLLDDFAAATAAIGDHAMLLNGEGYWLKSPEPVDEWGFMFKAPERTLAARAPEAWQRIQAEDHGQVHLADGVWTWQTIYPLMLGQKSSTRTAEAAISLRGDSERRQYVWKAVAHITPATLARIRHTVWLRLGIIGALLSAMAIWGLPMLSRAWQQRALAELEIRRINAGLEATVAERTRSLAESEEKHHAVVETMIDAVITTDTQGAVTSWNRAASDIFGWAASEALGQNIESLIIPADLWESHRKGMARFHESGQSHILGRYMELPAHDKDANPLTVSFSVSGFQVHDTLHFSATLRDITAHKRDEVRLRQAASVFEHANEGISITDAAGTIIDVNAAFSRITGYSREEVVGQNPRLLKSGHHDQAFYAGMYQALAQTGQWSGEIWNRRKDGVKYAEMLTISSIKNAQGEITSYVALFADITPLKEKQQALERIAHFDTLTGLPNRLLLGDRLRQAMSRAERHQTHTAVLYMDLDGFKAVNDNFGHASGDYLLVTLAQRMSAALREGDTLARLGGDEFIVVLPDLDAEDTCLPIIERLVQVANEPVDDAGSLLRVSVSIGVSLFPQTSSIDADQLLRQADHAMYRAKQSGKNRFVRFDEKSDNLSA